VAKVILSLMAGGAGVELPPPQAAKKLATATAVVVALKGKPCAGLSSMSDTTSVMQSPENNWGQITINCCELSSFLIQLGSDQH
jgi:hypothetical protein